MIEREPVQLDAIAFGAHPDDVELGCGGTIAKLGGLGYSTGVIALTRGEMGARGTPEILAQEFAFTLQQIAQLVGYLHQIRYAA